MPNSDECVITCPVGGIFGVARLATKLNELLKRGQIGPWHVGHWIDFKHTVIRINFLTTTDGEVAKRSASTHTEHRRKGPISRHCVAPSGGGR
jgi:hypothetical protein